MPAKPAKARLVSEHVTCDRVRLDRHRGAERCTVKLTHLRGTWKSALVLVDRRGHRIAERRIKRLRMPVTLVFYLPASSHPTRWTVVFRDGSRVARSSSLLVRLASPLRDPEVLLAAGETRRDEPQRRCATPLRS